MPTHGETLPGSRAGTRNHLLYDRAEGALKPTPPVWTWPLAQVTASNLPRPVSMATPCVRFPEEQELPRVGHHNAVIGPRVMIEIYMDKRDWTDPHTTHKDKRDWTDPHTTHAIRYGGNHKVSSYIVSFTGMSHFTIWLVGCYTGKVRLCYLCESSLCYCYCIGGEIY